MTARLPENVEVEFVPATLRKPCSVEVPVVEPCKVEVAVLPIYRVLNMEASVVDAPPDREDKPLTESVPPMVVLPSVAPPTAREVA